jgi:hypothetical protein
MRRACDPAQASQETVSARIGFACHSARKRRFLFDDLCFERVPAYRSRFAYSPDSPTLTLRLAANGKIASLGLGGDPFEPGPGGDRKPMDLQ